MTVLIATEIMLEVQDTLGTATAITALTKANPGVATSASHGLANGAVLVFNVSGGMVELDEQGVRIANVATDTFELEGLDTTNYSTWTAGTFQEVTAWHTLCQSTNLDIGNATPTELPGENFCSKKQVILYGLPGATSGTIDIQHDAQLTALQEIKAANVSDCLAFRVTWNNGYVTVFCARTAYSGGFTAPLNTVVSGSIPITVPNEIMEYAS